VHQFQTLVVHRFESSPSKHSHESFVRTVTATESTVPFVATFRLVAIQLGFAGEENHYHGCRNPEDEKRPAHDPYHAATALRPSNRPINP
jgi:hypothetical protein